jgi:tRNA(fMet)-specific endonuclease VapC
MTVADTDVLIDYLSGEGPAADRVGREIEKGRLWTTVITRYELLAGARGGRQEDQVRELLAVVPALILDEEAADRAAALRRSLEAKGQGIGMADSLLAGIVLANAGSLLTRNRRHFERVAGLHLTPLVA